MELMDKENVFKKHKKAVIVIIILLVLSSLSQFNYNPYQFGDALRNELGFVIGLLFGNVIIFFILFGIYYFIRQKFTKELK